MIDLTRIRTLPPLEEMKADLIAFTTRTDILDIYLATDCGEEDYDADKEEALYLLGKVENRIASLTRLLNRKETPHLKQMEQAVTSSAQ
jgi:hypothetical protein